MGGGNGVWHGAFCLEEQEPFNNLHKGALWAWPNYDLVITFGLVLALITMYNIKLPVLFQTGISILSILSSLTVPI